MPALMKSHEPELFLILRRVLDGADDARGSVAVRRPITRPELSKVYPVKVPAAKCT